MNYIICTNKSIKNQFPVRLLMKKVVVLFEKRTLLALDGNPLATLPEVSFRPINNTLRGISIGGRFLNCDCRLRWIFEWMDSYDLQVTSRERNPQFCGSPSSFRTMTFQQINPNGMHAFFTSTLLFTILIHITW